ncbi:sarcosine oxidase subunit gamma [Rhizobiales bacterium]|uniref:sarcosine oxidase subunit gamma n=1 Tax=Hongsoonwoonella zoysiae TaxID=2821844 RepID=UPI00156063EE|nr:sarcosine oxidase subunit gamma family protein [Hongsoonwoonella zoysiae]NRG19081.1 sarcosine oxidase subunit gamma [Hongsoonwoonella zoysiae]
MPEKSVYSANADLAPIIATSRVRVAEAAPLIRFSLRGGEAAASHAGTAVGVSLPLEPLTSIATDKVAAFWLGPDEWNLVIQDDDARAMFERVETALADTPHSLVDVSDRNRALIISGRKAAWLLNSQVFLDFDEASFPVGMVTRTLFGKAEIMLWRQAEDTFVIEAWRSFMPYVIELLQEASRELEAA